MMHACMRMDVWMVALNLELPNLARLPRKP